MTNRRAGLVTDGIITVTVWKWRKGTPLWTASSSSSIGVCKACIIHDFDIAVWQRQVDFVRARIVTSTYGVRLPMFSDGPGLVHLQKAEYLAYCLLR